MSIGHLDCVELGVVGSADRFASSGLQPVLCLLFASSFLLSASPEAAPIPSGVSAERLSVDLGDLKSRAELTWPTDGKPPFATVILVHGNGPHDMDTTTAGRLFRELAWALSGRGFAVLRYDKHYVSGPADIDWARFGEARLPTFASDLEKVIAVAKKHRKVDAKRLVLYGWGEGSAIAAAVAAKHPELRGLVFQGAVALPWAEMVLTWFHLAVSAMRQSADDGFVTADTLRSLMNGNASFVVKLALAYFCEPSAARSGKTEVSSSFDLNHDGKLAIDTEVVPALNQARDFALRLEGPLAVYHAKVALPTVTEQAPHLSQRVLVLQGEYDGSSPERGLEPLTRALRAAHVDAVIKRYPGLGHTLNAVIGPEYDGPGSLAPVVVDDVVAWLGTLPSK